MTPHEARWRFALLGILAALMLSQVGLFVATTINCKQVSDKKVEIAIETLKNQALPPPERAKLLAELGPQASAGVCSNLLGRFQESAGAWQQVALALLVGTGATVGIAAATRPQPPAPPRGPATPPPPLPDRPRRAPGGDPRGAGDDSLPPP